MATKTNRLALPARRDMPSRRRVLAEVAEKARKEVVGVATRYLVETEVPAGGE